MYRSNPQEHSPCIWTEAGVINFLQCNSQYECAKCSFGLAMSIPAERIRILVRTGGQPGAEKESAMSAKEREDFAPPRPQFVEVFGFQVPTSEYYLHRGHAWAVVEDQGRVRVGVDEFSQKILGPADELKLPEVGKTYYQDHICLALIRQGKKASVQAPVDGIIEAINPKVCQEPSLIHDDPYGEGWLLVIKPTNLERNLGNLSSGQTNAAYIDEESHRLLNLVETEAGVTLPDGGAIVDDVYGHFPKLGWRRLVQEFLWKKEYMKR